MHEISQPLTAAIVIQARLGSVRFPAKVLADLDGRPLVEYMIERVRQTRAADVILLAVPEGDLDSPLTDIANRQGVMLVGGEETDVLARFAKAVSLCVQPVIVRLTADCPLVDPEIIDYAIQEFARLDCDYLRTDSTFPDGLDVEVTRREAVLAAAEQATFPSEREHVMPWIATNPNYSHGLISRGGNLGKLRLTVDEPQDLAVVRKVLAELGGEPPSLLAIEGLHDRKPWIFEGNSDLVRDEGAVLTDAQKLWRRAKRVMPGGVSLLSKRPDMHLPDEWPTYFSAAKGCQVTSLDGRQYLDMGLMGVGTSILGFGDPRVDEAVSRVVRQGVVSTLNCPEEVLLAERLVELHPWAKQARFARSGGEACAMAIRIARAASGRDGVAICGYHGWHDWYLAANLSEDRSLDGHLLPGLSTRGVPRALVGTTFAFDYNDLASLEVLTANQEIGVIIMEVERSVPPLPGFLERVRQLATERGIVLIFDESTSGFRRVLGGLHLFFDVHPDLAVFGKTLGNGYAITSVLGSDEVMDVARDLFISSTFWSERIGPAAGLAAIAAMEADEAPRRVHNLGLEYRRSTLEFLASTLVEFSGLPAISTVGLVNVSNAALLKTFVARKLLERGYLSGLSLYMSLPHAEHLLRFSEQLANVLSEALSLGDDGLERALADQPLANTGFARLA